MPRMNNTSLKPFLERHSRLLSIAGLVLVFVTFIVKDAIREQLKDSLDSISAAENLYLIREDSAAIKELVTDDDKRLDSVLRSMNPSKDTEKPSQLDEMLGKTVERDRTYTLVESSLENTSRVVETLPDPNSKRVQLLNLKRELEDIRKLDKEAQNITSDFFKNLTIDDVLKNDPTKKQEALHKDVELEEPLVSRTFALVIETSQAMNSVTEEARKQYESQERLYKLFTWLSYLLYAAGWGLSVVGQSSPA